MHCFGSFLSQAMFLSLQVFAFKGQNMKLTVKMLFTLFTCIVGAFTMTWVWFLNLETVKDVEGITKAKYPIETRNDRLLVFLTSADSLTSEIFVDFWLSLDMSIGTCTFSRVSMT